jgi:CarD family transcriptional regulator
MRYSVGDKIVHPFHGPGLIAGIEQKELLGESRRYYVIEVPGPGLTIYLPVRRAGEIGIRAAMSPCKLERVLTVLRGKPHLLPEDYRERQEQVSAQLRIGRVIELVRIIRDLSWHGERAHLTRKDAEYLKQARNLLAAEIALVSGGTISDANNLLEATMNDALASGLRLN